MTVSPCFQNLTAAQNAIGTVEGGVVGSNLPPGSQLIDLSKGGALTPQQQAGNQAFQAIVVGSAVGVTVSATIQPLASNDGIHWLNYGSAITIASGPSPGQGSVGGSTAFAYYSATLTAISGNGAKATCYMNA